MTTIKEGLKRLEAFGLLKYDKIQKAWIDSNFCKELTSYKSRNAITRLCNNVEDYVKKQTIADVEKMVKAMMPNGRQLGMSGISLRLGILLTKLQEMKKWGRNWANDF